MSYPTLSQSQRNSTPFNEEPVPERKFDVCLCQSLSKSATVLSTDYKRDYDPEFQCSYVDTSDTNWQDVWAENELHTPDQLIKLFQRYLQDELDGSGHAVHTPVFINHLIKECDGWIIDETDAVED